MIPKIPESQKPAIKASLYRLRTEAFGGDKEKTWGFLKECLGDFGVPIEMQESTLVLLMDDLNSKSSPNEDPKPEEYNGPRIISVKFDKNPTLVTFKTEGCSGKPVNGKVIGNIFISTPTQKGVSVDQIKPGQLNSKKTFENAFGSGEHSLNVRTGDKIYIWIKFFDGTKTPPYETTWPWKST